MKDLRKSLLLLFCAVAAGFVFDSPALAQGRDRVVRSTSSQPTNLPTATQTEKVKTSGSSRPVLTNDIKVVRADQAWEPLVQNTVASKAVNSGASAISMNRIAYGKAESVKLDKAIKSRYGIRYRYGSSGPNTYDCSGFVWSAFQEAGIPFTRASARSLWSQSQPVSGDDRFKFGTLVFLNGLGHMGIVADENGFYHASSSKGITYSPFKGYWSSRIVGFRKLNAEVPKTAAAVK